MTDDSSHSPELFDQDTCETFEAAMVESRSDTPDGESRPLAAVGLAIFELDRSSRFLAQLVRHVDTTQR
jgi:hypothetical protein